MPKAVAEYVYSAVLPFCMTKHAAGVQAAARRVVFHLGATNFSSIESHLRRAAADRRRMRHRCRAGHAAATSPPRQFGAISLLSLNHMRLLAVLEIAHAACAVWTRGQAAAAAPHLRAAIWCWIEQYPHEFIMLCERGGVLGQVVPAVFVRLEAICRDVPPKEIHRLRVAIWPLQMALLLLAPG